MQQAAIAGLPDKHFVDRTGGRPDLDDGTSGAVVGELSKGLVALDQLQDEGFPTGSYGNGADDLDLVHYAGFLLMTPFGQVETNLHAAAPIFEKFAV